MAIDTARLRDEVLRLRPDWRPERLSGFLYLEGGYSNHNFRFDHDGARYVLRAPQRARPFVDRHLEAELYAQAPVPMPEVVAFDPASGYLISRWVAGPLLADLTVGAGELVGYLRDLHARLPAMTRRYDPVAQARTHLAMADPPAWLKRLAAELNWHPAHQQPCHNDLNPWNVIRGADGWVTLDWEWTGMNDPLFDLVTLHQGAGTHQGSAPDALADWAEAYLGQPVDDERLRLCLTGFWLREAAWAMAEIAAGNDRPEIVEQQRLGLTALRDLNGAR
jgi:Ser/Thr protein kinase RdoA (MazF antagonist)